MTCVRAATFNLLTAATFNQLTTFFVASSDSDVYVCLVCCQIYLACRSLLLLYYPAPAPTRVGVGVVVVRARLRLRLYLYKSNQRETNTLIRFKQWASCDSAATATFNER